MSFELFKEIKDKEGRYIVVKGKTLNSVLTFVCIYAPPNSPKSFFKDLFDLISVEAEGICICAGDFNVILNYNLDTTSQTRCKTHISRHLNLTLEETGLVDVWRLLHPSQRDYTHYSIPHSGLEHLPS
uniref:Endonuclease/exonuclease/phosphatase domain-containing protein n=1 Tax=Astatotilapia calliptera TaxID=8154 RepID=A0A3P8QDE3_ASTCA